jgi:hypothetical protein
MSQEPKYQPFKPRTFPRGKSGPLYVRENLRTGDLEFVRSEARLDGRGMGRWSPYPLPEELAFASHLARARKAARAVELRVKGTKATAEKAEVLRHVIQLFAIATGWPERGAAQKVVSHFAPIGGSAPRALRCSRRTVMTALGSLPRPKR